MKVFKSSSWRPVKEVKVYKSGWKTAKQIYKNINGTWTKVYEYLPSNMIVLYDGLPSSYDGYVCDGLNGTPNLINYFASPTTNVSLLVIGSGTHDGSLHGQSAAGNTSTVYHSSNNWGIFNGACSVSSHGHSIPPHTHSGEVSNSDSINKIDMIPVLGSSYIYQNAVFLRNNTNIHTFWSILSTSIRSYVRFNSISGFSSALPHKHDYIYLPSNTSSYYACFLPRSGLGGTGEHYPSHGHRYDHFMSEVSYVEPASITGPAFKYTDTEPLVFTKLPIGSLALFTSNDLPYGWELFSSFTGTKLLSFDSEALLVSINEGTPHIHPPKTVSNTFIRFTGYNNNAGSGGGEYAVGSHTHSWSDTHNGEASVIPLSITLFLAEKIF